MRKLYGLFILLCAPLFVLAGVGFALVCVSLACVKIAMTLLWRD